MRILGLIFIAALLSTRPAVANDWISLANDDPAYVTFSAGYFDADLRRDEAVELSVEYRSDFEFWWFKPFAHAAYITNNMTFVGAGILLDVQLGDNWIIQPSIAPTWWRGGTDELDLDFALEFRSRIEIAYRFPDKSRLGISASHSSNASLGDRNPGTESVMLNLSIPTGFFRY